MLNSESIPYLLMKSSAQKKQYSADVNRMNILLPPSSKGLEFDTVVIIDSSFVPQNNDEELVEQVRKLYVGMTRAQRALLPSYHRANDIGASLSSAR
ncbi:3'-5' exonuclease [Spongiibacter tropicus]|uniref:3'-5' exonuclease n=1 Tax=Spongiibacter tropicus TaxID=454602 RepID=UPI001FDFC150|nr:3'-5' exonuclease [Spongiibacter tropicus]